MNVLLGWTTVLKLAKTQLDHILVAVEVAIVLTEMDTHAMV